MLNCTEFYYMKKSDLCYRFDNSEYKLERFKKYVEKYGYSRIIADFSALNIFDAIKFAVLSSVFISQNYPSGRLKCRGLNSEFYGFMNDFSIKNLEFV